MFHPNDTPMERGWVGRVDGDRVLHLAAQTLQSFFLGGGGAREHAEYRLEDVTLLAPVLQPPNVRLFDAQEVFAFANATAVTGPGAIVRGPAPAFSLHARIAAVIGAEQQIGGYSALAEWRTPGVAAPKDRDFALVLGPVVVTPDEFAPDTIGFVVRDTGGEPRRFAPPAFDWVEARAFAAAGTMLRPGDILGGPPADHVDGLIGGVELEAVGVGVLRQVVG